MGMTLFLRVDVVTVALSHLNRCVRGERHITYLRIDIESDGSFVAHESKGVQCLSKCHGKACECLMSLRFFYELSVTVPMSRHDVRISDIVEALIQN